MQTIQSYIPITRAKTKLLDMVRMLHNSNDTIAITKNGVPEAVLMSMEKFDGLMETMEILSDEETVNALKHAIKEVGQGVWIDFEEVLPE